MPTEVIDRLWIDADGKGVLSEEEAHELLAQGFRRTAALFTTMDLTDGPSRSVWARFEREVP